MAYRPILADWALTIGCHRARHCAHWQVQLQLQRGVPGAAAVLSANPR